ncbi:MAG: ATP-binding protein, partial [Actinomycetaceae bacterium]|nr:ATP-binding protein [Actinomycetaceae bacterium]
LENVHSVKAEQGTDLADVLGQDEARFALEIAAAGGHHLLMTGSPGVGKSMLASCLPRILPPLTEEEAVEVAAISSALGDFNGNLSLTPPFIAPHHSVSSIALVGGGNPIRPGAISRAHNGVLFLDELPEFSAHTIQALRQPMENGSIDIHRARMSLTFPARFQLVGAANPCRCGNFLESPHKCTCSVADRRTYYRKIGGPILDRFDMNVILRRPRRSDLTSSVQPESSVDVAGRVAQARKKQEVRLYGTPFRSNAQMSGKYVRSVTSVPADIGRLFDRALAQGDMTMRGIDKALRLAWTISDLSERDQPQSGDFHQALLFRSRTLGGK